MAVSGEVGWPPLGNSRWPLTGLAVDATLAKTATSVEVVPTYSECTVKEGETSFTAHVHMNSCHYNLTVSADEGEGEAAGPLDIACGEAEDKVEVRATFLGERQCLDIPPQTPGEDRVDYRTVGEGTTRSIDIAPTVESLSYTRTGVCGSGEASDGTYEGEARLTGEDGLEEHVGIWVP